MFLSCNDCELTSQHQRCILANVYISKMFQKGLFLEGLATSRDCCWSRSWYSLPWRASITNCPWTKCNRRRRLTRYILVCRWAWCMLYPSEFRSAYRSALSSHCFRTSCQMWWIGKVNLQRISSSPNLHISWLCRCIHREIRELVYEYICRCLVSVKWLSQSKSHIGYAIWECKMVDHTRCIFLQQDWGYRWQMTCRKTSKCRLVNMTREYTSCLWVFAGRFPACTWILQELELCSNGNLNLKRIRLLWWEPCKCFTLRDVDVTQFLAYGCMYQVLSMVYFNVELSKYLNLLWQ